MIFRLFYSLGIVVTLTACYGVIQQQPEKTQQINNVVPKNESLSKLGNNPYVVNGILYTPLTELETFSQQGIASWYGNKFHGRKTSSGEIYNMYQYSAAHKTLPIPSYIKVTNLNNNKSLIVRVNDRGPFAGTRILDLSYGAAGELDFVVDGTTNVSIELVSKIIRSQDTDVLTTSVVYLQTGVFSKQKNAFLVKSELESYGYHVKVDKRGDALYRVKVGPFANAKLAFSKMAGLEKAIHQPVILITEKQ